MEYIKTITIEPDIFSVKGAKPKVYDVYRLSIPEMMKRYFTRHKYMWFVRKSESNFIFYFEPYYKRVGTEGYEVIHCAGGKSFALPTRQEGYLKEILYGGAKSRKYLSLMFEYLSVEQGTNNAQAGIIE